ncbi:MAG: hypothetical protein AVDCRST_MAG64-3271, partial [uncultured Phycisphaerae bacterium]
VGVHRRRRRAGEQVPQPRSPCRVRDPRGV